MYNYRIKIQIYKIERSENMARPKGLNNKTRVSITLSSDTRKALELIASEKKTYISLLIEECCTDYIKKYEKAKKREEKSI